MTRLSNHAQQRRRRFVRPLALLFTLAGLSSATLSADTITSSFIDLGPNDYLYTYSINIANLSANQGIYIEFDPTVYNSLSDGTADSDFTLVLQQPNNPPGAPGAYSAKADVNNPSLAGPFSVQVSFLAGSGQWASQPWEIQQFNSDGVVTGVVESGNTGLSIATNTPEPATATLVLTLGSLFLAVRLRRRRRILAQAQESE